MGKENNNNKRNKRSNKGQEPMNYPRVTLDYEREILQELIKDKKSKVSKRRGRKRIWRKIQQYSKRSRSREKTNN